jgi:hypothetical protein
MRKNVNNIKKNKKLKVCLQESCIFSDYVIDFA